MMRSRITYRIYFVLVLHVFLAATGFASGNRADTYRDLLPALGGVGLDLTTFVLYEREAFTARLGTDGILRLYLKNDGEYIGKPIIFGQPGGNYYHRTKRIVVPKKVVAYYDPPKPTRRPDKVKLQGRLEGNLHFHVAYEFRKANIRVTGWHQQVSGVRNPIQFVIATSIASLASDSQYQPRMEGSYKLDIPERTLERYTLKMTEFVNNSTERRSYHYGEKVTLSRPVKTARIKGPWGHRVVHLRTRGMHEDMVAHTDSEWGLAFGYKFIFYTLENALPNERASYSITIN